MPRKKTTEEFISDAIRVHGGKYNYDKVEYKNRSTRVEIYCNKCKKYFMQTPNDHLSGCGCPTCGRNKIKAKLYGVGVNDIEGTISYKGKLFKFYEVWMAMFNRCYNKKFQEREQTYIGCTICDEWKSLSNFKKWFDENYTEGYELDKDLLGNGSKIYSPSTCCFVPKEINALTTNKKKNKSKFGVGVYKKGEIFCASISKDKESLYIGSFKTEEEARSAYIKERRKYIIEVADKYYNGEAISGEIRDALKKYAEEEFYGQR